MSLVLKSALFTTQSSWFPFLFLEHRVYSSNIFGVSALGWALGGGLRGNGTLSAVGGRETCKQIVL